MKEAKSVSGWDHWYTMYGVFVVYLLVKWAPLVIYKDNCIYLHQLKECYINGDRTKHISQKFFFTQDLKKYGEIDSHEIRSNEKLADMFTMLLPAATLEKFTYDIELRRFRDISWSGQEGEMIHIVLFFPCLWFFSHWVFLARFLMRQHQ